MKRREFIGLLSTALQGELIGTVLSAKDILEIARLRDGRVFREVEGMRARVTT